MAPGCTLSGDPESRPAVRRPVSVRPRLSLVVCTLDEAEAIGGVLDESMAALEGVAAEIIVVDDSEDGRTAEPVLARAAADPRIRLLRRHGARGLASAAIAGWNEAEGEVLAVMDGDGQHDPARLPELLDALDRTGADVALASRYSTDGPSGLRGYRDRLSRAGTRLVELCLGVRVSDPLSGLFLMRREWYVEVRPRLSGVGFKILVDVLASGSRRPSTAEVMTALRPRAGGASKLDARVMADLAAMVVEKRTAGLVPARFVLFLMVGATGVAVHLVVLQAEKTWSGLAFPTAQAGAILAAMTTNFLLNNLLTFRDRRLRGGALLGGLLLFYLACSIGAGLNELVGWMLQSAGLPWLVAGGAGAVVGALVNYALSRRLAWGLGRALDP